MRRTKRSEWNYQISSSDGAEAINDNDKDEVGFTFTGQNERLSTHRKTRVREGEDIGDVETTPNWELFLFLFFFFSIHSIDNFLTKTKYVIVSINIQSYYSIYAILLLYLLL